MSSDYKNQVEAILFASGRLMEAETLLSLTGASGKKVIEGAIKKLIEEYEERKSPLMIVEEKGGWKLTVRETYLPLVRKIISDMELPKSLLETLAVVAWKAPVMQSEVVDIRHNKAYDHIKELEDLGFIAKEAFGRSYMIKLTNKFFEYFDIEGKKDLREIFNTIKETPVQRKVDEYEEGGAKPDGHDHLGKLEVFDVGEDKGDKRKDDIPPAPVKDVHVQLPQEMPAAIDESHGGELEPLEAAPTMAQTPTVDDPGTYERSREEMPTAQDKAPLVSPEPEPKKADDDDVIDDIEKIEDDLNKEFEKDDPKKLKKGKEVVLDEDDMPAGLEVHEHDEEAAKDLYDKVKSRLRTKLDEEDLEEEDKP